MTQKYSLSIFLIETHPISEVSTPFVNVKVNFNHLKIRQKYTEGYEGVCTSVALPVLIDLALKQQHSDQI